MFMRFAAFLFGMFGGGKGAGAAFQVYPGMPQRRNSSGGGSELLRKGAGGTFSAGWRIG